MKIISASPKDAKQLVLLAEALGYETDIKSLNKRLSKILTNPDHCLLVAKEADEAIGFCHGYVRTLVEVDEAVEIGGLVVLDAWQGKGVGKQLLHRIETWARSHNFYQVVLSSNIMRTGAHKFYQRFGYQIIKQQYAFKKLLNESTT